MPISGSLTGAAGMSHGPALGGPDKAAPTAASFRDGRRYSRNRQSAAVLSVPGLASAGGTPRNGQRQGVFAVAALQGAQPAGEPVAEKLPDR